MYAVTLTPAPDFEQGMQPLDAMTPSQPWQGEPSPWPTASLTRIEQELDLMADEYLEPMATELKANMEQFDDMKTFVF